MGIFKRLSWFFKQEKKSYLVGIGALIIVALLQLIPPRIIGIVVDEIEMGIITQESLLTWLLILASTAIGQYVLRYLWRVRIWGNAAKLEQIVRKQLFDHFTNMDNEFFQKYRTGDLMAHATNDLRGLRMVAGGGILTMADAISVGLTTLLAMIFIVDWRLTLLAIIPLPLLAMTSRVLGQKLHLRFRDAQAAFSHLNDKVQESIQGIKVIKTFGQEKEDIEQFSKQTDNVVEKNRSVYKIDSLFDPAITFIMGISYFLTILVGGWLISGGEISVGDFVTFINYIGMLVWPMFAIGRLFNIIERGSASYDRIENLLREETSIVERQGAIDRPVTGELSFELDSFSYPDEEGTTLKNIHFTLEAGGTLGVVGKTGAGKTTILKLLLREYDGYKGRIRYGGYDIRDYTLDALLKHIGYVPQDNYLFSDTIRENIRFADPSLSQEAVEAAAKLADIHEDILAMPNGYDTEVGERGVSLSGGQKQRISIARAILINPELMILDDSLSAVDAKTEESILSGLKELRRGQTTIIAAHRISSVMHAEEIIVVEDGEIVERGTHNSLLEQDGWYKDMYEQQQLVRELEGGEV
ncbi:ABC transporter ATP-binding protein [Alkalibacterium pelagium]|jgi:ATP-binding cassette subfamily B protein|uniref:ATP-binding cassette, subfamily B n=1 Tax=Alkalibacterium pelagium TaxID=426702 RepID=A0A1H7G626_9LACT|nr:ABC transporter transmembrane domain-containing protein [Alkalibacterium pelagium]GEN49890.1 multidrug ABC transporter permease/ATP-binding protein [Alkalibacterium pelagium]SEK33796.1 ATP-binding cassette, subfamily B [Alkalibacterium pelagium]